MPSSPWAMGNSLFQALFLHAFSKHHKKFKSFLFGHMLTRLNKLILRTIVTRLHFFILSIANDIFGIAASSIVPTKFIYHSCWRRAE